MESIRHAHVEVKMTHDEYLAFLDGLTEREQWIVQQAAARFWTVGAEWFARVLEEIEARDAAMGAMRARLTDLEALIFPGERLKRADQARAVGDAE